MTERTRRRVCAAAIAVLGLGAADVLARPAPADAQVQACSDSLCARICRTAGFPGGFCNSGGGCSCYL